MTSRNVPTRRATGTTTVEKGAGKRIAVRDAVYLGGMYARREGRGFVSVQA